MIPAPFEYQRASSVAEAVALLQQGGEDARLLAGGHSLLPLMRLRLARPSLLVDIGRIAELAYIREDGAMLAIGALTRHHDLHRSELVRTHCGVLAQAAGLIGDPQVRHRGTIGGAVAHGDPASDLPAVLLALDAEFVVEGPAGRRTIPATSFFTGLFQTALDTAEVLVEVRVPKLGGDWAGHYEKFRRRAQDWAIVGVAAVVRREDGHVAEARIGLTNMGATPLRATAAERALAGADPEGVAAAAELAAEGTSPPSDPNGSAEYRHHLARVLTRRAVLTALG